VRSALKNSVVVALERAEAQVDRVIHGELETRLGQLTVIMQRAANSGSACGVFG
jgi:hypothetical protein